MCWLHLPGQILKNTPRPLLVGEGDGVVEVVVVVVDDAGVEVDRATAETGWISTELSLILLLSW